MNTQTGQSYGGDSDGVKLTKAWRHFLSEPRKGHPFRGAWCYSSSQVCPTGSEFKRQGGRQSLRTESAWIGRTLMNKETKTPGVVGFMRSLPTKISDVGVMPSISSKFQMSVSLGTTCMITHLPPLPSGLPLAFVANHLSMFFCSDIGLLNLTKVLLITKCYFCLLETFPWDTFKANFWSLFSSLKKLLWIFGSSFHK